MIRTYGNAGKFSPCPTHYSQNYRRPPRFVRSTASWLPPTEKKSFSHPAFVSVPYRSISNKYPYLQYPSRSRCRKHLYRYKKSDWIRHYKPIPCVHEEKHSVCCSRTAEDIIQQIECGTFVVVCIISTATNHYMCLMCVFSYR